MRAQLKGCQQQYHLGVKNGGGNFLPFARNEILQGRFLFKKISRGKLLLNQQSKTRQCLLLHVVKYTLNSVK